jgi:hypothetical protein
VNLQKELKVFKAGALPVIAAMEIPLENNRASTWLWVNALNRERHFKNLRMKQFETDGLEHEVFTTWSAAFANNPDRPSLVRLDCVFKHPTEVRFSLLFKLPETLAALCAISKNEQVAIVPVQQSSIKEQELRPSLLNIAAAFEVPSNELRTWLTTYASVLNNRLRHSHNREQ